MIDPKQKAELIVEKFYSANQPYTFEPKAAKECAKIHVEGILEALPSSSKNTFKGKSKLSIYEEWQEVLNELNKM